LETILTKIVFIYLIFFLHYFKRDKVD